MAERRVVVTGLGIVSSIGNNKEEVEASLRAGRSGIVASEVYTEMGYTYNKFLSEPSLEQIEKYISENKGQPL